MATITFTFDVVKDGGITSSQLANTLATKMGWTQDSPLTKAQYVKQQLEIALLPALMIPARQVIEFKLQPEVYVALLNPSVNITN